MENFQFGRVGWGRGPSHKPLTFDNGDPLKVHFQYLIKDHLASFGAGTLNVSPAVLFEDKNQDGLVAPNADPEDPANEVLPTRQWVKGPADESYYYPFGMGINEKLWATAPAPPATPEHAYTYNGKEVEKSYGLGWSFSTRQWVKGPADESRMYDAEVGRFTGVDPIAGQFSSLAVYNYASNSPVINIDLHGLQGVNFGIGMMMTLEKKKHPERTYREINEDVSKGALYALPSALVASGAVLGAVYILPSSVVAIEASSATIATNVATDAVVQTAVNIAKGDDPVTNYDIAGGAVSALSNPFLASALDGAVNLTVDKGLSFNSPEAIMINTLAGGAAGTGTSRVLDALPGTANKARSVVNGIGGLYGNAAKAVGTEIVPEYSYPARDNTAVQLNLPITLLNTDQE